MKYWSVRHTHTCYVEAETEAAAREDCAAQVRSNADADECEAEEIDERSYGQHWAIIENAKGTPCTTP